MTDAGFSVIQCGLVKWMQGLDCGNNPADTKALDACLKQLSKSLD